MKKVKLVKLVDDAGVHDLTIEKVYNVESYYTWPVPDSIYSGLVATILDDVGEENELYESEYEVVE